MDLLVHILKLMSFFLRNIEPHGQVVVVLDQLLNRARAVRQVLTQRLALLRKLLHNLGNLDAV